ncbi:hypothetical protein [Undibacterium sp.]|uniref:hypothetical protein n=1 Tax=Undibacterium sp. TaxID=1914977 RepID=UPI00374C971F
MRYNVDCSPLTQCFLDVKGARGAEMVIEVHAAEDATINAAPGAHLPIPVTFAVSRQKSESLEIETLCRIAMTQFLDARVPLAARGMEELDTTHAPWTGTMSIDATRGTDIEETPADSAARPITDPAAPPIKDMKA